MIDISAAGAALAARLVTAWRRPVYRDGLALVASSALSSLVGLAYWVLAARLFPPAEVGVGSALVSTMMLLGGVGQLNLDTALLRFVPVAGPAVRRLVTACYAVAVVAAAVVGVVFGLGAPWWAPDLVTALGPVGLVAFLGLAAPVWALFVLQDHVLAAVGRAVLVPVANLVFALVKVALLVAAAALAVPGGIAVSWAAATALLVVAVTAGMARARPTTAAGADRTPAEPITVRAVATFAGADYVGEVCWTAVVFGLPVVVLARLGAEAAATFGIAWTLACTLSLVPHGLGQALVAHLAADPTDLAAARRGMTVRAFAVLVPAVVLLGLVARPLLAVFGPHYAATGVAVLVVTALSALPDVVVRAALAAARVARRRAVLVGLPAGTAALILGGTWLLAPRYGLLGVGVVVLGAQLLSAGAVLAARGMRRPSVTTAAAPTVGADRGTGGRRSGAPRSNGAARPGARTPAAAAPGRTRADSDVASWSDPGLPSTDSRTLGCRR